MSDQSAGPRRRRIITKYDEHFTHFNRGAMKVQIRYFQVRNRQNSYPSTDHPVLFPMSAKNTYLGGVSSLMPAQSDGSWKAMSDLLCHTTHRLQLSLGESYLAMLAWKIATMPLCP